ncbi:MAG: lipoprotein-releasing ABC transporter permease subunit [Magnetococcales bacterium]|nr:lipoprotein-releasing ABC transporter permease subunit [Magnetococcales bacterium]
MFLDRYEWMVGLRYLRAKRSQHFISVITFLSMGGIALGVAALIVVLAVMTGFKEELQQQILGVTSHVVVQEYGGRMAHYPQVLDQVNDTKGVEAAAPYILEHVMVSTQRKAAGVVLRGVLPTLDKEVSALHSNLTVGSLEEMGGFGLILGKNLALTLGVTYGDRVTVIAPMGSVTAVGTLPRMKRFKVAGIFDSGMYEYDKTLVYIHMDDAQKFFRYRDEVTGIEVRTSHPDIATTVRKQIQRKLGGYWVTDWMQMNRNFFRALQVEKAAMFIILLLVVVVAAFNIVSSLIMVVMEKGRDIAVLKTMGATGSGIMKIFMINGGIIGLVGASMGLLLGLLLAFNLEAAIGSIEKTFGIKVLPEDVYFIDHLPSQVESSDVLWITLMSLAISLLATLYPAWRAARVDPVEALRHD